MIARIQYPIYSFTPVSAADVTCNQVVVAIVELACAT